MEQVVLVIHMILALAIIGLVLLQRSEGGGLGIGSSGGMGALATAHTTANVLTRATGICAAGFFTTSLILGILSGQHSHRAGILERINQLPPASTAPATAGSKPSTDTSAPAPVPSKNEAPAPAPAAPAPAAPPQPTAPISK